MAKISEIMLLQQSTQPALIIEAQTDMGGLPVAIGESFMKIGAYIEEQGMAPADVPFVMYKDTGSMTAQQIRIIVGFKLAKALPGHGEIKCVNLPEQKIALCMYKGGSNELMGLYKEMLEWIKSKGYEADGSSIEYYYSGPDVPESEQVTRIEIPLKN